MSSKSRSTSLTRPKSTRSSSVSHTSRSQNVLATVHSPEVVRSINSDIIDQTRFPILSGSVDNNRSTTLLNNDIPLLTSDGSHGVKNITSQLESVSTNVSTSPSAPQNNTSTGSTDTFSSPLPYNPNSGYNSSSSSNSSCSSSSEFVSSSKNEIASFMSQEQFNQLLQAFTMQNNQRMLVMEKELSQLRTENISLKMMVQQTIKSENKVSQTITDPRSSSNDDSALTHSPRSRSRSRKVKMLTDQGENQRVKEQNQKVELKNEKIYNDSIDDNPFTSYNAFLICRQNYFPVSEFPELYDRKYSLLCQRGRVYEYLRFMIVSGCTELLYPLDTKRWYDYFQYYMGIKPTTSSRLTVIDHKQVKIPSLTYDDRDAKLLVSCDSDNDLPPNPFTLSGVPKSLYVNCRRAPTLTTDIFDIVNLLSGEYKDLLTSVQTFTATSTHKPALKLESHSYKQADPHDLASNLSRLSVNDEATDIPFSSSRNATSTRSFYPTQSNTSLSSRNVKSEIDPDTDFDIILPQIISLFGPVLQPSIRLAVNQSNWTETKKAKEYELAVQSLKKFGGHDDEAPSWFQELCVIIVRFKMEISGLNLLLLQKLISTAAVWYRSIVGASPNNVGQLTIIDVLKQFKTQYLGSTQVNDFEKRIRALSMKSIQVTKSDLDKHYEVFVKLMTNIMTCETTAQERQYVVLYKDSLSLPLLQLMGDVDKMETLNEVHRAAASAVLKLKHHNTSLDRIRKPTNTIRMYRCEHDNDYDSTNVSMESDYSQDEDGLYYVSSKSRKHVNALPSKYNSKHSSSSHKPRSKHIPKSSGRFKRRGVTPPKTHTCWHCGSKGHMVGVCPLVQKRLPQTSDGKRAYADYCAETGSTTKYDVDSILQQYKKRMESRSRSRTPSRSEASSVSETSDISEAEISVISDDDEFSSVRADSPAVSSKSSFKNKKRVNVMKVVYSMCANKSNIELPSNVSSEEKKEFEKCLTNESVGCDSLGLPIKINNINVGMGLVDQGASSAIISRSLMQQHGLHVREYKVKNHCVISSSGKEVALDSIFLGSVMTRGRSLGRSVFYVIDDTNLDNNELIADLIIGRSLLAQSDYHHMDIKNGQLYNDSHDIIQCDKVDIQPTVVQGRHRNILVPVLHSQVVSTCDATPVYVEQTVTKITDDIRRNKVKFGLTLEQIERLKQKERFSEMKKYVNSLTHLADADRKHLKKFLYLNVHKYHLKDEDAVEERVCDETVEMDECDVGASMQQQLTKLYLTDPGSEEESKVLKHIFSVYLPTALSSKHGLVQTNSDCEEADEESNVIDSVDYPLSAPTEVIDTPEYRSNKKQKLKELIRSYTHLNKKQQDMFIKMLYENMDCISINGENMRQTKATMHEIDTGDTLPFKEKLRNYSPAVSDIILAEVDKMIKAGVLVPSKSPYATNLLLVRKPDKSEPTGMKNRVCASFVKLNDRTVKDSYPLPNIQEIFHRIGKSKWFTTMDLLSGFWQVMIKPEHRHKTAVITARGLYEFVVMAFGLCNAPATFQRLIDTIFIPEMRKFIETYIDDLMTHSLTFEDHVAHVGEVLKTLRKNQLTVKLSKCKFAQLSVKFLGHIISQNEIKVNPEAIQKVLDWERPKPGTNFQKAMRGFLGLTGWYRKFIPHYADIARPLVDLTKKNAKYEWTEEHEKSFRVLRDALTSAPVLRAPDPSKDYILHTDASNVAMSGVAQQYDEKGELHPVAYWSKSFNPAQRNYSTTDRECLALVTALEHFKTLLEGHKYVCLTDHRALIYLMKNQDSTPRLNRLMLRLAPYEIKVKYLPGKDNHGADLLSRDDEYMIKSLSKEKHVFTVRKNKKTRRRKLTEESYEVEKIVNKRQIDGSDEYEYEVKWKNYDSSQNTWQTLDELRDAMELVVKFEKEHAQFSQPPSINEEMIANSELKCSECSYVGVNESDVNIHMSKVHSLRVPARSCVSEIYELDVNLLKQLQQNEPQFKIIYDSNYGEHIPDHATASEKRFLQSQEFVVADDGLLYCVDVPSLRMKSKVRTQLRLCLPKSLRKKVLEQVHGGLLSAHPGIIHTYDKLRENVWWPSLLKDVSKYVTACSFCIKSKSKVSSNDPIQPMSVPQGPFEIIHVDITGPLPVTNNGNVYILVAVDRFTRYVEAWPMTDQQTKTVTLTFIRGFVCRHGIPLVVISDRGSPFVSHLAQDLYKELGIKRIKTTAWHPQSNGLVERFNGTLKIALKLWANENQDDWDLLLCYAVFAYNTSYHSLVQETPYFLTHGRDANLHINIMLNTRREKTPGVHEYATEVVQKLYDVHMRVKEILENENTKRIDNKVELRVLNVGDQVLLHDSTTKVGLSRKLTKRWRGPFTVLERNSDVTYTIVKDGNTQLVNVHRLKLVGDEKQNSYLEHEDDLLSAESELISLNNTIENLLALKAAKEHDKNLLENAVQHDRSVVDESGQVVAQLTDINETVDDDSEEIQLPPSSHANVMIVSSSSSSALIVATPQMRTFWC